MASSLAHDLAEVALCYEQALAEFEDDGSLAHAGMLLQRVDALLPRLSPPRAHDTAALNQLRAAGEAHARLLRSVQAQRTDVERLRTANVQNRRALAAYGSRLPATGSRVERDA